MLVKLVNTRIQSACITKIRTNFNLNFLLYYASARGCLRKPDFSNKQSYSQNGRCWNQVRSSRINRRAVIILWISEINRLWRYGKIYGFKTVQRKFQKYASEEESLERTYREDPRNRWKGSSADFGWSRASLRKLASIVGVSEPTMHRIAEEDLWYKSYTLKIR